MKAIQQIAGRIETLQTGLANNERIDVFAGACAFGRNLTPGTLAMGFTEIPMDAASWQLYSLPCEVESGGGVIIRVPGVYLLETRVVYPALPNPALVTIGLAFGYPAYTMLSTATIGDGTYWQSAQNVRYIPAGGVVRLCVYTLDPTPITWQWAFLKVALLGMFE